MAERRTHRGSGCDDIPVASFSDIAFLLIIFFILATTLVKTQGFRTDLPSGQKSEQPPEKTTTVHLAEGQVRLNDEHVSLDELRARLAALGLARKTGDDKVVLFETAGKVVYQDYFEIMACIAKAGGTICIVTEESD